MRLTSYSIFATLLASSVLAQQATNAPQPPIETPAATPMITNAAEVTAVGAATNAPSVKKKAPGKKKSQKKSASKKEAGIVLKTMPLLPGPAVVDANHVNVRGQAKLTSEVVTRLAKDQHVTVLEEIIRNNSGPDEPSAWAKILLPTEVHVWVNNTFVDANTKAVKPKKLNVRSGPGENYSVLGRMVRGETVNQISVKGDWLEIEAPTNAYAFVAAQYLKQPPAPATPPVETVPTPAAITNEPPIAAAPTESPGAVAATEPNTAATPEAAPSDSPGTAPAPAAEEPPPRRIVEREGIVRGTSSIQAPTHFELVSPDNHRPIDYLFTTSPDLDLRRYKGLHIVVTGEEGLEERWGNTPVITIQKIQVVE